ncbi:MAG TPA: hypothetical protein VD971_01030 [Phycisphaerales bacterium]|nr:hypothetical protein [Phycisphaerales bacterium]
MSDTLFDIGEDDQTRADARLIEAYVRAGRGLDDLAYTPEFEAVMRDLASAGDARKEREVLQRLQNLRKAKKLPALGRTQSPAVKVSTEEEQALREIVLGVIGTLGQRDQLPYTPAMDAIAETFMARCGRPLSPHDLWRLIQKLAK